MTGWSKHPPNDSLVELESSGGDEKGNLLITADAFGFYKRVVGRVFGPRCIYGQVIKRPRSDRVLKVERRAVIGAGGLEQALLNSENSAKLNSWRHGCSDDSPEPRRLWQTSWESDRTRESKKHAEHSRSR